MCEVYKKSFRSIDRRGYLCQKIKKQLIEPMINTVQTLRLIRIYLILTVDVEECWVKSMM